VADVLTLHRSFSMGFYCVMHGYGIVFQLRTWRDGGKYTLLQSAWGANFDWVKTPTDFLLQIKKCTTETAMSEETGTMTRHRTNTDIADSNLVLFLCSFPP
jgi:hypothetical protein